MKAKLDKARLDKARRGTPEKVEEAALFYARWKGLTHEEGVDREAAKESLDVLLDTLEAEDLEGAEKVASTLGDATFKGLLVYAVSRARDRNGAELEAIVRGKDWRVNDKDRS